MGGWRTASRFISEYPDSAMRGLCFWAGCLLLSADDASRFGLGSGYCVQSPAQVARYPLQRLLAALPVSLARAGERLARGLMSAELPGVLAALACYATKVAVGADSPVAT